MVNTYHFTFSGLINIMAESEEAAKLIAQDIMNSVPELNLTFNEENKENK